MARTRKALTPELLDQKIEQAEAKVERTKKAYDNAKAELKALTTKRNAVKKETLWDTVVKSEKSYEEILEFAAEKNESVEESVTEE